MADDLVNWRLLLGLFLFGLNQFFVIFVIKTAGLVDRVPCGMGKKLAIRREVRFHAETDSFPTTEAMDFNRLDNKHHNAVKRAERTLNKLQKDFHERGLEKFFDARKGKSHGHNTETQNFVKQPDGHIMAKIAKRTGFNQTRIGHWYKNEAVRKRLPDRLLSKT
ncbi:uncharacterized protein LOC144881650 [Branchiostoma floridae x Branchiostoma japonicum]